MKKVDFEKFNVCANVTHLTSLVRSLGQMTSGSIPATKAMQEATVLSIKEICANISDWADQISSSSDGASMDDTIPET